jgi:ABC-type lipoprotein export system ATPase subunit
MSGPLLLLKDVFAIYRTGDADTAALQGVELAAGRGEVVCVHGPSGAGKTTLLRVIAGVQQPTAGSVLLLGQDIGRLGSRARALVRHRQIGAIGQSAAALSPDLSIEQVVALPLALRGVSRRDRAVRASALLELTGLHERRAARPIELSGGERQRVALCAAIVHRPALLLADEPTAELDAAGSGELLAAISATARVAGTSVIIASHDPDAGRHADRTVTLRDGRIVEEHRKGHTRLTVSESGWLRLPEQLRSQAAIGERVTATAAPGSVTLTSGVAADGDRPAVLGSTTGPTPPTPPAAGSLRSWLPAAVALRGVTRSFTSQGGTRAVLGDLSWEFTPGVLTVVTGRSGSGKSTLLRLLAGLDSPDRGQVTFDGQPIQDLGPEALAGLRRDRIGYLSQEPLLVGFLSAAENVELSVQIRNRGDAAEISGATEHLTRLGLGKRLGQRVTTLSAGEVQRVGLARALVAARGLVIADEPTSRLDRANATIVAGWLADAATQDNQTVICATHDPLLVARAGSELRLRC